MTLHVGIIGGGNISDTHARAALETDGIELAGYWGRNPARTARLAREYGGRVFSSVDELLDHRPLDAVIIGTPSGAHADYGTAAARRGLHVLVEKPLDVSTERIDALIAECDGAGVRLGVIYQDRAAPALAWLRRFILDGNLGDVFLVSASVRWYRPPGYYAASPWRGTWALDGGGALMNQGIHTVDLLLWLFGDVARVSAATRTALHAIEVEDTVVACLELASGAVATIEATTAAYPGFPRRIAITGTEGTVVVEHDRVASVQLRKDGGHAPPPDEGSANASASSPVVGDVRGHARVLADFAAAVASGGPLLCEGRDGRRSVALVEAIYHAARAGTAVAPGDVGAAR